MLSMSRVSEVPVRMGHQYRVRYQRVGWATPQQRVFSSLKKTQDFLDKLDAGDESLAPMQWVALDRRDVPPWQPFKEWRLGD